MLCGLVSSGSEGTPEAPGTNAVSPPDQAPPAGLSCRLGRSRAVFGSGPAICYEGLAGEDDEPGSAACAACTNSNAPDACLACPPGHTLVVKDP
eukprot:scaffold80666_cov33-Prasinocladus_malaysianus.AAC.1